MNKYKNLFEKNIINKKKNLSSYLLLLLYSFKCCLTRKHISNYNNDI